MQAFCQRHFATQAHPMFDSGMKWSAEHRSAWKIYEIKPSDARRSIQTEPNHHLKF
jgi:hypothetical protein